MTGQLMKKSFKHSVKKIVWNSIEGSVWDNMGKARKYIWNYFYLGVPRANDGFLTVDIIRARFKSILLRNNEELV